MSCFDKFTVYMYVTFSAVFWIIGLYIRLYGLLVHKSIGTVGLILNKLIRFSYLNVNANLTVSRTLLKL